jgi:hypothetical protein
VRLLIGVVGVVAVGGCPEHGDAVDDSFQPGRVSVLLHRPPAHARVEQVLAQVVVGLSRGRAGAVGVDVVRGGGVVGGGVVVATICVLTRQLVREMGGVRATEGGISRERWVARRGEAGRGGVVRSKGAGSVGALSW